ncbi:UNVERIFIED_CONTAM: hypothetical protein FKN15_031028 [Acipenser sinensis]
MSGFIHRNFTGVLWLALSSVLVVMATLTESFKAAEQLSSVRQQVRDRSAAVDVQQEKPVSLVLQVNEMANRDDQLVLWLALSSVLVVMATLTESFKGKDIRSERKGRVKHKYTGSSMEEDYEKSINDMVMQLQNNSALSGSKCEIDLRLWMSNRRSLSPWSYRVNRDETRIPTEIPEAHSF